MKVFDICIIGSGPSGLFSAFQSGMLGMESCVIESLDSVGGQCSHLYPEKFIYDIPGIKKISGQDLINDLYDQANQFGNVNFFKGHRANYMFFVCNTCLNDLEKIETNIFENLENNTSTYNDRCIGCKNNINYLNSNFTYKKEDNSLLNNEKINYEDDKYIFAILTSEKKIIFTKSIIIAAGSGSFEPKRLPIKGILDYENNKVFYKITNREIFSGKRILVAGGGDSAIDWSNDLSNIADVTLIHRREDFTGVAANINFSKVNILKPYVLENIKFGDEDNLDNIAVLKNLSDSSYLEIEFDYLLVFFGLITSMGSLNEWGLELGKKDKIIVNPTNCESNLKMIFAIGDCSINGKPCKLIATGFDEASQAVHEVYYRLNPGVKIHYSTTKFS